MRRLFWLGLGSIFLLGFIGCGPSSFEKEQAEKQRNYNEQKAKICSSVSKFISRCNAAKAMTSSSERQRMVSEAYSDLDIVLTSEQNFVHKSEIGAAADGAKFQLMQPTWYDWREETLQAVSIQLRGV